MQFSLDSDEPGPHACVARALRGEPTPRLALQNNPTVLFMRNIGKNLALENCCSSCRDNYYNFSFVRRLLRCIRLKPELKNYRGLFTVLRASLYLGRD